MILMDSLPRESRYCLSSTTSSAEQVYVSATKSMSNSLVRSAMARLSLGVMSGRLAYRAFRISRSRWPNFDKAQQGQHNLSLLSCVGWSLEGLRCAPPTQLYRGIEEAYFSWKDISGALAKLLYICVTVVDPITAVANSEVSVSAFVPEAGHESGNRGQHTGDPTCEDDMPSLDSSE